MGDLRRLASETISALLGRPPVEGDPFSGDRVPTGESRIPGENTVWQGHIFFGDDEVEARVRRMDEHALLAEARLPVKHGAGREWEALEDDIAARAYEQALLHLLGRPPTP